MEHDEGDDELKMRTVDCLRGRLLAERQASKVAQQQAQFMSDKLTELEDKLREETKLRQKADKRLHLLIKKLQSLEISPTQSSDSSEIISGFCSKSQVSSIQDSNADSAQR